MAENFILGVRPLQQFMEDGSFLMPEIPAAFRAIQALHAPDFMDYTYLLSVSGSALRIAWQQGWAGYDNVPNQGIFYNEGNRSIFEILFDRIGLQYTMRRMEDVGPETAAQEIKASIDRGIPVLMNGVFTILGYRDDALYGIATFLGQDQVDMVNGYHRINDFPAKTDNYILLSDFCPRAMDAALLKEVLQTAVYQARTTRLDMHGDTALGVSSFDALAEMLVWDESFAPLDAVQVGNRIDGKIDFPYDRPNGYYHTDGGKCLPDRFWCGYCDYLCMLNEYDNFADFLKRYAAVVPAWKDALEQAAEDYHCAADYSGALWQYVSPDDAGVAKFKEPSVRYAFAAHMLRAKIFTLRAVERLEKLLKGASGS